VLDEPKSWHVICVSTPLIDLERRHQFWRAIELIGCSAEMLGAQDTGHKEVPLDFQLPNIRCYDMVISHNERGEYGHPHHKQVHFAAKEQRRDLICFGWGCPGALRIQLSDAHLAKKQAALHCYGDWYGRLVKAFFKGDDRNLREELYVDRGVRL
jgi:hypothetical protein